MANKPVYVGVTGGATESGVCRDSIDRLSLPDGSIVYFARGTKGYESRQRHVNSFIDSTFEWLLMLDADMVFPPDTAMRLLAHDKTYVSGLYLWRKAHEPRPIWFMPPNGDAWPLMPFVDDPERGRLHELGASGWGCVLLHRSVIEDTRKLLRNEPDVIEDDMDVWPYDLQKVMAAVNGLRRAADCGLLGAGPEEVNELYRYIDTLSEEIRPLRGVNQGGGAIVGSDIRYAWYARQAGHVLWGDPDTRCGHMTEYNLTPDDYSALVDSMTEAEQERGRDNVMAVVDELHEAFRQDMAELGVA